LIENENQPEVCLIVKDADKKDRDYEKTIRKYQQLIEKNNLSSIIREVIFAFIRKVGKHCFI
jgi:hypothetical protein